MGPRPNDSACREWVREHPIIPLPGIVPLDASRLWLAGVLPYRWDQGKLSCYLMRPVARKQGLPDPLFQIGKGTRMRLKEGYHRDWRDIRPGEGPLPNDPESVEILPVAALREAIEELGLVLDNVRSLFNAGQVVFASASSGEEKPMALFAALLHEPDYFGLPDEAHGKTAMCRWVRVPEDRAEIRGDHALIIDAVAAKLPRV